MELMNKTDIAHFFGISRQLVNQWEKRYDVFPDPVHYVNNGRTPLYDREQIKLFKDFKEDHKPTRSFNENNRNRCDKCGCFIPKGETYCTKHKETQEV